MARKRMIDPQIWDSEQVMGLSSDQFKIFIYLFSNADDEGRFKISYPLLVSRIFPLDSNSKYNPDKLKENILHIAKVELICMYTDGKDEYLYHPHWDRYQTISHATASHLPDPSECTAIPEDSDTTPEDSVKTPGSLVSLINIDSIKTYAPSVKMKEKEYAALCEKYGKMNADRCVEKLSNYKEANGKKYKSDYRAILNWVVTALELSGNESINVCPECGFGDGYHKPDCSHAKNPKPRAPPEMQENSRNDDKEATP